MPHALTAAQHRTIAALAESVAPPGTELPVCSRDVGVADGLDSLLMRFDPVPRRTLKGLIAALRFAPLLRGKGATFPNLSREQREAYLRETLSRPGLHHDVVLSLRALCEMIYAGDHRFRESVGDRNEPFKPGVPVPAEIDLPVTCHPELGRSTTVDCDVVIVGSGAGGGTIARELAGSGISVVIVEEGGPVHREDFHGPPLHRVVDYYRDNGFTATRGSPLIPVPMGRVVGGTTVVNSGTCLRAPDSVLQEWVGRHGLALASPDALGPAYEEVEACLNVQPVTDEIMGNNGRVIRRGAKELNLRAHPIPRPTRDCVGTGQCAFGCPRDAKQAMHLAHLPEAVKRGARIYGRCRVERLLIQGRRATGVVAEILDAGCRRTGHRLTVRAQHVFLCAGAIYTPWLLMRHRLGRESGAIGRHLRIHPGSGVTGKFAEVINGWRGVMQSFAIDEFVEEGVLLEATFPPLGMTYSAGALPGVGKEHAERLADYPHMASVGSIVSDAGTGRVRIGLGRKPVMQYRLNPEDTGRTIRAIAVAARVLFAAGATEVYPGMATVPVLRSANEVDLFERRPWTAKDLKLSAYHPMGTARMGADPSRHVCDPLGRVYETENLYVGDTSLFPESPHVNPQLTLMALCLNLARRFVDDWPSASRRV
jgi:choline dehydrogenase-like flavoprotein